ncbi:hypothetical protein [Marinobacter salicampi]|uniref:hypothetical protein n=1 Tax=Marinobacter salicampi TaxID=435907 RepID=UPI001F5FBD8B|nr:hypothetical protein [Marinobacter salicampi]
MLPGWGSHSAVSSDAAGRPTRAFLRSRYSQAGDKVAAHSISGHPKQGPGQAPVRTTCPYCGVGCGVIAGAEPGQTVTGDKAHPANTGRLCVKGSSLGETLGTGGGGFSRPMSAVGRSVLTSHWMRQPRPSPGQWRTMGPGRWPSICRDSS